MSEVNQWFIYNIVREVAVTLIALLTLWINRGKRTISERLVDSNQSIAINKEYGTE